MTLRTLLMALLFLPLLCRADATLYKWKDADGTVHFSDQPRAGAEKVEVHDIQTVPATKLSAPDVPEKKAVGAHYDSVSIVSPANGATFHDNTGNISVSVQVTPPLRSDLGHKLELSLDGVPQGAPGVATQFSLSNVDRGTHNLQASVLDKDGRTLISGSSVFYLHRHSVINAPNAPKANPPGGNSGK